MKVAPSSPPKGTVRDWLDHRAAVSPDEAAFVFAESDALLSWQALRIRARDIASGLTSMGVLKGQSVAVILPNCADAVVSLYGLLYGGYRATMINLQAGDDAIVYALKHSDAEHAIVGADQVAQFDRTSGGKITRLDPGAALPPGGALHDLAPDDHALLMYTSGTTGRPKGVIHTHASLLAGGWTTTIAHALTSQDRGLCVLPIYHINGLCVSVMGALISGGSLAMCPKFSASRFWQNAGDLQVTWFSVVPTIISHLLHSDTNPDAACFTRLRFGRSASSALAPDVQTAFETRFGVPVIETMGLTETAAQILSNPLPPGVRKIGSPGIAYGNEVKALAPDLTTLPRGKSGEIAVRGPNVMREYLKNPQATTDSFTADGWLRTGDLGRIDQDGYVFITGRLKELIIKGGENIAPREIDEVLYSHADVIEAAAFARPCASYGERVEAAVKIKTGSTLSSEDLIQICKDRLGAFKSPEHIYLLNDLPKGPSGKIQRMKLAEMTAPS
ncbi:MAG: AMP-binding protein [Sulfitobacter sp.]